MKIFSLSLIACMPLVLLLPACKPKEPYDARRIDGLRAEAEQLITAQAGMGYDSWVHGAASNQDSLYRAHAGLFTRETIRLVADAERAEPDTNQKRRLRYFRRYLTTEYIAKEVAPLTDEVTNLEARAMITVGGTPFAYRQLNALLANERSAVRRAALYAAADPVLDSLNLLHRGIHHRSLALARELGYASYTDMVEQLKGFSLPELGAIAEGFLSGTDSQYTALLQEIVPRMIGVPAGRFRRSDTPALFRSSAFDRYFPADGMLQRLRTTYAGMGIPIDSLTNLRIDAEPRPTKNPRAVCYPVDIPDDVRLSIKPVGGPDDYAALFHEMGHGLHYALTTENAFEFKYLGEPTVTETYAFLSEYLLDNQAWLRMKSGMPTAPLKEYVRLSAFQRLFMVRRYAAKVLYEMQLHAGVPDADSLYVRLMARSIGVVPHPSDAKRFLVDIDPLFYSAGYLRAWFLEAQLNAALGARFGVNWFEHRGAGEFLRSLWAQGDRLDGDGLASQLGVPSIMPDALLESIRMMLVLSTKPSV